MTSNGRELIQKGSAPRSLFSLRFRKDDASVLDVNALGAKSFSAECVKDVQDQTLIHLDYVQLDGQPISVRVTIRCPKNDPNTYWSLSVDNQTGLPLEHIDFPTVVTPNDLVGTGGDAKLFWPGMEGVEVEDLALASSALPSQD